MIADQPPSSPSSVTVPPGTEMATRFRALQDGPDLLVVPNPYDVGTARLLEYLGFEALATTSAGFARTLGRPDAARAVDRDEAVGHSRQVVEAVAVPVTGDLEDGFAVDPAGVARTVTDARAAGLAGCCIEDATYQRDAPIIELGMAVERVEAAADAAHAGGHPFVLTARAENLLYGWRDLDETVSRVRAYAEAGADAVYAPGLITLDEVRRVVDSVDRPVNVLVGLTGQEWSLDDLRAVGVARVSVGSAMSRAALSAVVDAARELLDTGRLGPRGAGLPDLDTVFAEPGPLSG